MKSGQKVSKLILGFVKLTGILPALLLFKPKVYLAGESASRKLPKRAILMSNHTSLMDFVLYLVLFPFRTIHFLMAAVLFNKGKAFGWFLYKIGGIFVNRDACDFSFVDRSLEILKKKGIVGIFPQGRLPVDGKPFPFKPGIVLVALRTDAPIIPIYTDGNYSFTKRARVIIGEPIYISNYTAGGEASDEEIQRLTKLLEEKTYELKAQLEERLKNGK